MATDCSIPQERRTNIAIKTSNKLNTLLATFANSKAQEICQDGAGVEARNGREEKGEEGEYY